MASLATQGGEAFRGRAWLRESQVVEAFGGKWAVFGVADGAWAGMEALEAASFLAPLRPAASCWAEQACHTPAGDQEAPGIAAGGTCQAVAEEFLQGRHFQMQESAAVVL